MMFCKTNVPTSLVPPDPSHVNCMVEMSSHQHSGRCPVELHSCLGNDHALICCVQAWQTLVELPPRVWMESVQLVYDYFCERTPRSFVEARDTSVVWNYRYAGVHGLPIQQCLSLYCLSICLLKLPILPSPLTAALGDH